MELQRKMAVMLSADELKVLVTNHLRDCGMSLPRDVKEVKVTDPGHDAWEFCGLIVEWTENAKITPAPDASGNG